MANLPKPKLLPRITYDPPQGDESQRRSLWSDAAGLSQQFGPYLNNTAAGIFDALNMGGDYLTGVVLPQAQPKVTYPDVPLGPPTPTAPWDTGAGRTGAGTDARVNYAPGGADGAPGAGEVMGPPSPTQADWNAVAAKNRNLYQQAQSSGDTANMARLDAEWKRIQPLAAQYGISAQRLVNSYMQPGNSAAKGDLGSALAAAISDDVWAKEATNAFGRPPNQLEWDEHFRAMNFGGRDPLEGHPQSVENIKNAMNNIGQANQNQSYAQYSQWLAGQ